MEDGPAGRDGDRAEREKKRRKPQWLLWPSLRSSHHQLSSVLFLRSKAVSVASLKGRIIRVYLLKRGVQKNSGTFYNYTWAVESPSLA